MQILLIRHGESEADILDVHEGRADFPLTERGVQQVHRMAARVKEEFPPEFIWASTLKRASETARILAETVGCPIEYHDDLREHDNGLQAGLPLEEGFRLYPQPEHPHEKHAGGESRIEFRARIEAIFSCIKVHSQSHKRIAIVAHGGVVTMLLKAFLEMPVTDRTYMISGDTGIHLVEYGPKGRVVHFMNSTEHLR